MTAIDKTSLASDWLSENSGSIDKIDLGLARCYTVLKNLNLQIPSYKIFTVAGTNGKGSTVAILDSILSETGYRTGRYTSPHLQVFNERILIQQEQVSDAEIIKAFEQIRSAAIGLSLTYFEYSTIAALFLFARENVDVALLEVGLGGRLDAVNSVDADVSIISSISLDHQDWLGDDLEQIAFEKAGIMRKDKPCILAESHMPKSLHKHARSIKTKLVQKSKDYAYERCESGDSSSWIWQDKDITMRLSSPNLHGEMQLQNAAAAISALKQSAFWPISELKISNGLQKIYLPGRGQIFDFAGKRWMLDVAHNPASIGALVDQLQSTLGKDAKIDAVFSMLKDKDARTCVEELKPYIENWFIAELDTPRSLSLVELVNVLLQSEIEPKNIYSLGSIQKACEFVASDKDGLANVLVCGSFYTVGDALNVLKFTDV